MCNEVIQIMIGYGIKCRYNHLLILQSRMSLLFVYCWEEGGFHELGI